MYFGLNKSHITELKLVKINQFPFALEICHDYESHDQNVEMNNPLDLWGTICDRQKISDTLWPSWEHFTLILFIYLQYFANPSWNGKSITSSKLRRCCARDLLGSQIPMTTGGFELVWSNKSWAWHHHCLKLGSKLKYLNIEKVLLTFLEKRF